jgi:hypothetical protein
MIKSAGVTEGLLGPSVIPILGGLDAIPEEKGQDSRK